VSDSPGFGNFSNLALASPCKAGSKVFQRIGDKHVENLRKRSTLFLAKFCGLPGLDPTFEQLSQYSLTVPLKTITIKPNLKNQTKPH